MLGRKTRFVFSVPNFLISLFNIFLRNNILVFVHVKHPLIVFFFFLS